MKQYKFLTFFLILGFVFAQSGQLQAAQMTKNEALAILELKEGADLSKENINKAYKKMALKWHPDKNMDNQGAAEIQFKAIGAAKEFLLNPPPQPFGFGGGGFQYAAQRNSYWEDIISKNRQEVERNLRELCLKFEREKKERVEREKQERMARKERIEALKRNYKETIRRARGGNQNARNGAPQPLMPEADFNYNAYNGLWEKETNIDGSRMIYERGTERGEVNHLSLIHSQVRGKHRYLA